MNRCGQQRHSPPSSTAASSTSTTTVSTTAVSSTAVTRAAGRRRVSRTLVAALALVIAAALPAIVTTSGGHAAAAPGTRLALTQPPDILRAAMPVPAPDADTNGMWTPIQPWPMIAIHAVLAQNGDLVTYGARIWDGPATQDGHVYDTWSPATGQHAQSDSLAVDSFCNIAVQDRNGTVFVVGGNSWNTSGRYDPVTRIYEPSGSPNHPRWYSSLVRMPDDRLVVLGGSMPYPVEPDPPLDTLSPTPEVYDPATGTWRDLTGATSLEYFGGAQNRFWYPRSFLAPDGRIFGLSHDRMWALDPTGNGTITSKGTIPTDTTRSIGPAAAAVMYTPGRILIAGGGNLSSGIVTDGTTDAAIVDITSIATSDATVTRTGSMHRGRNWINLVTQPDGTVLAIGGVPVQNDGTVDPSLTAERWDPTTGTWTELAAAQRPRTYHASALLMPNGSVFSGGSGAPGYPYDERNAEFFYPPSLFRRDAGGVRWADRPEIRSIAGVIANGGTIEMDLADDRTISTVSLITAGSNTHSVTMGERRVPLTFQQTGALLTATFPTDPNVLPPGVYLLTAVGADGVPSPSQLIEIRSGGAPGTVTVYGQGLVVPPLDGTTPPPPPPTTVPPTTVPATTVPVTTTPATTTPATTTPATTTPGTTTPGTTTPVTTVPVTATPATTPPATTPAIVASSGISPSTATAIRSNSPIRLMDTRRGLPTADGEAAGGGAISDVITLRVAGRGPVPTDATGSVALNVTVTEPSRPTYVTVWPTGQPRPLASNLNVAAGDTTPNLVIVPIGTDGTVSLFNHSGDVELVVDLLGHLPAGAGFTGLTPARLLDTRPSPTIDGIASGTGALDGGTRLTIPIAGRGGVPLGAAAVALNLTATGPTTDTHLTIWPTSRDQPTASSLNVRAGETRANLVIVPLGTNGAIDLSTFTGRTDVVIDVLGWFQRGVGFTGVTPARLLDTRPGQLTVDGTDAGLGRFGDGTSHRLVVTGRGGVPADGVGAVALNVTVDAPLAAGHLTVHPGDTPPPTASNLNFTAGRTVANAVIVPVAADGTILLEASTPVHAIVDVLGWFPTT